MTKLYEDIRAAVTAAPEMDLYELIYNPDPLIDVWTGRFAAHPEYRHMKAGYVRSTVAEVLSDLTVENWEVTE